MSSSFNLLTPLSASLFQSGGRNSTGRITSYHKGGGIKTRYRLVDFHRTLEDVPAVVIAIHKDPQRTAPIALVCYSNGILSYIISPKTTKPGSFVISSQRFFSMLPAFSTTLLNIPIGTVVHGVELIPGAGSSFLRAAGVSAQVLKKFRFHALLRLRSGEHRFFSNKSLACVGAVGNEQHKFTTLSKAGQTRWQGIRPTVRGEAMNPVDHPHGGNTSGGRHPQTPWGRLTRGVKTRNQHKKNSFILKSRHTIS